jgi:hypothetical protein
VSSSGNCTDSCNLPPLKRPAEPRVAATRSAYSAKASGGTSSARAINSSTGMLGRLRPETRFARWPVLIAAGVIATYHDELIPSRRLEAAIDNFPLQQLRWLTSRHPIADTQAAEPHNSSSFRAWLRSIIGLMSTTRFIVHQNPQHTLAGQGFV